MKESKKWKERIYTACVAIAFQTETHLQAAHLEARAASNAEFRQELMLGGAEVSDRTEHATTFAKSCQPAWYERSKKHGAAMHADNERKRTASRGLSGDVGLLGARSSHGSGVGSPAGNDSTAPASEDSAHTPPSAVSSAQATHPAGHKGRQSSSPGVAIGPAASGSRAAHAATQSLPVGVNAHRLLDGQNLLPVHGVAAASSLAGDSAMSHGSSGEEDDTFATPRDLKGTMPGLRGKHGGKSTRKASGTVGSVRTRSGSRFGSRMVSRGSVSGKLAAMVSRAGTGAASGMDAEARRQEKLHMRLGATAKAMEIVEKMPTERLRISFLSLMELLAIELYGHDALPPRERIARQMQLRHAERQIRYNRAIAVLKMRYTKQLLMLGRLGVHAHEQEHEQQRDQKRSESEGGSSGQKGRVPFSAGEHKQSQGSRSNPGKSAGAALAAPSRPKNKKKSYAPDFGGSSDEEDGIVT